MNQFTKSKCVLCLLLICCISIPTNFVFASNIQSDAAFQIGTTLYEQGLQVDYALRVLKQANFDWVAIEVNWAELQPYAAQSADFNTLNFIYQSLQSSQQKLFIRLVNAPQWALTPTGPDIQLTLQFLTQILGLFPSIQAVEIFPGANIQSAWGVQPSVEHYMALLNTLTSYLQQNQINTTLIAGGFSQIDQVQNHQGILDLTYLQSMYDLGLRDLPVVISIQFENIINDPEMPVTSTNDFTLRHYELIRQIMVNNVDHTRLMWVTKLTPPNQPNGKNLAENQAEWMQKALTLIRSQLYIQVCILQPINPDKISSNYSLITPEGTLNPIIHIFPFYALKLNNSITNNVLKLEKQNQILSKQR